MDRRESCVVAKVGMERAWGDMMGRWGLVREGGVGIEAG